MGANNDIIKILDWSSYEQKNASNSNWDKKHKTPCLIGFPGRNI